MGEIITTKNDLLNKLRAYVSTPDDDNIRYKEKIHNALEEIKSKAKFYRFVGSYEKHHMAE